MSYEATINFTFEDSHYLTIKSSYCCDSYDVTLSCIYSLIALLELGNHKFDDDVIDYLKTRIEELRDKSDKQGEGN